ncbi:MAG: 3-dehydro-L-gulonate 2-dehydrogenase [Betaproteobacteria bacterium]|nr:3-dehydro-L-gulonate 2-dehydrogenase [Betaproteobacteria bacterium]
MTRIAFEHMHDVVFDAFRKAGMNEPDARTCARVHTESSCDGIYSHGLNRVPRFVDYLRRGWINLDAKPALVKRVGPMEIHDGDFGAGIPNALRAIDRAQELAATGAVGIVALRNTTHWMRGGTYGWRAAERGFVAIAWTNTEACMPAWGGRNTRIGNNPFVMAVPRAKGPLVLDMAMSQYSYGKLQVTRLKGEKLPYPGGFDGEGRLTSEPGPIEQSMRILPMGYWKGSGFSVVLDTLAAVLSEGLATHEIDTLGRGSCGGCSQVFIAVDPRQLGGQAFTDRVADGVVDYVTSSTPAEDAREVRYPGEAQLRTRADHRAQGIVVDDSVWADVLALAGRTA